MSRVVTFGEIMLRLDPGEGRIRTTREFRVWEGGGEYNVARGLRRCFGLKTAVAVRGDIGASHHHVEEAVRIIPHACVEVVIGAPPRRLAAPLSVVWTRVA